MKPDIPRIDLPEKPSNADLATAFLKLEAWDVQLHECIEIGNEVTASQLQSLTDQLKFAQTDREAIRKLSLDSFERIGNQITEHSRTIERIQNVQSENGTKIIDAVGELHQKIDSASKAAKTAAEAAAEASRAAAEAAKDALEAVVKVRSVAEKQEAAAPAIKSVDDFKKFMGAAALAIFTAVCGGVALEMLHTDEKTHDRYTASDAAADRAEQQKKFDILADALTKMTGKPALVTNSVAP